jgi:hypothetical protein
MKYEKWTSFHIQFPSKKIRLNKKPFMKGTNGQYCIIMTYMPIQTVLRRFKLWRKKLNFLNPLALCSLKKQKVKARFNPCFYLNS